MKAWAWVGFGVAIAGIALWLWTASGRVRPEAPRDAPATPAAVPAPAPADPSLGARAAEAPAPKPAESVAPPLAAPKEGWVRLRVLGSVVDGKRKPVARIGVELRDDERTYASGATAQDGTFDWTVDVPPADDHVTAVFTARDDARMAWRPVVLRPSRAWHAFGGFPNEGERDVGAVPLVDAGALEALVTADGAPKPGAEVRALPEEAFSGAAVAHATTDEAGRARLTLPTGRWSVSATAAGRGRAGATASVPAEPGTFVRLDLPVERVVAIRVVDATDDTTPVPGATIRVTEQTRTSMGLTSRPYVPVPRIEPTDAAGLTRLSGANPTDVLRVTATAPGFAVPEGGRVPVKPGDAEVKVAIARLRSLAWPVVAGERPVPADGTAIRLAPEPGTGNLLVASEGRMEGARLVVDGLNPGYVNALAYAPDGSVARLWADGKSDEGKETSFRAPRRIDVALTYADGAPASGWYVRAMNQGNNPMGRSVATDAAGKAVLGEMHGQLVEVYASTNAMPYGGRVVGSVDLEKGSGQVNAVVSRMRTALAHARGVSAPLDSWFVTVAGAEMGNAEVDEAAGGVRFSWWPSRSDGKSVAWLHAPGFQPARAEIPNPAPGDVGTVEFEPKPAATIVLRVLAADLSTLHVRLQRWNEERGEWGVTEYGTRSWGPRGATLVLDAKGVARLDSVVPGRYRAFEENSSAVSAPADPVGGGAPVELVLDCRSSGPVKGRVLLPEGFSPGDVTIVRDGEAPNPSPFTGRSPGRVAADGTFSYPVSGGAPVVLRPSHPLLVPAAENGAVTVTGPREDVVLRMVVGRTATVRFDREPKTFAFTPGTRREKVLLYRGDAGAQPAASLQALVEGTTARFGGFEAGTYTVWLDVAPFAPVVLRDVKLGEGETDLGLVRFSEGSGVRVNVLVKEGQAVPRLVVNAVSTGAGPAYSRFMNSTGSDVRLTGLGAGTFRVTVDGVMGGPTRKEETVEVDGVGDATLTFDLR